MSLRRFFIDAVVCLAFAGGLLAADSKGAPGGKTGGNPGGNPGIDPKANRTSVWESLVLDGRKAVGNADYPTAEQFFLRALHEAEGFPAGNARAGSTANMLGLVYREEKKYREAEESFTKALTVMDKAYGPESLDTANVMFNLSSVLLTERRDDAALPYLQKSQAIYGKILGEGSMKVASTLCMAGQAYAEMKKVSEAEASLKKCADLREASGGIDNADFGDALYSLGLVYQQEGRYPAAEQALKMAEKIREVALGITSPGFADALEAHASVLRLMGRAGEAAKDEAMAAAIRSKKKP